MVDYEKAFNCDHEWVHEKWIRIYSERYLTSIYNPDSYRMVLEELRTCIFCELKTMIKKTREITEEEYNSFGEVVQ